MRKLLVKARPSPYPLTTSQKRIREINERCGIRKGMKRAELVKAMRECIPEEVKRAKEGDTALQSK